MLSCLCAFTKTKLIALSAKQIKQPKYFAGGKDIALCWF